MRIKVTGATNDGIVQVVMNGTTTVLGSIGRFTYGEENIELHWWGESAKFLIGRYCSIAGNIQIFLGGNHRYDWITTFPFGHLFQAELGGEGIIGNPWTKGDVLIGNDVWIGTNASIMSGVSIGDGAVIAANAHVVGDIPAYTIFGGNPARKIRARFDDAIIERLLRLRWWEFSPADVKKLTFELSQPPTPEKLDALLRQTADWSRL